MLPSTIKNWTVIIDGRSMAGKAESVKLPSLERNMVDYEGGGMLGPVEIDMGIKKLTMEFTLKEFNPEVIALWGLFGANAIGARFLAAETAEASDASVDAIEIAVRGRWNKLDLGEAKKGEANALAVAMPLTSYKYSRNGVLLHHIDLV
ncbi:MAG: phage major tail tube protein, partial [Rhodospirillaceae bacterium]